MDFVVSKNIYTITLNGNINYFLFHIVIHVLVDKEFLEQMHGKPDQVVIYMKTVFMLANEIVKNTNWPKEECKHYLKN